MQRIAARHGEAPGYVSESTKIEPFSSWLCLVMRLAELQYVNGLGEFPGAPGAAAELAEDLPGLELGVCPLAGAAEPRVGAVGLFLGFRLVLALVRVFAQVLPW
jgi:hypothetical protein